MTRPRLVATDLDGTLLRPDGTVSDRTLRALAAVREAGVDVVFVTARPPRWVDELSRSAAQGVVICLNGALVYDAARARVLHCQAVPDDLVRDLTRDLRAVFPTMTFAAERSAGLAAEHGFAAGRGSDGGHGSARGRGSVGEHPVPADAVLAPVIESVLDGATAKLLACCPDVPDVELVGAVERVLAGRAVVADSGARGLAEVHHVEVSKGAALARWSATRECLPADVWAFGDMPNDLPMLRWAGRSFAVANAHPAVRAEADEVCGSNEQDGVAVVLERLATIRRGGG